MHAPRGDDPHSPPTLGRGTRKPGPRPGRWSPDGDRVAFVVDGYVVDRVVGNGRLTRWTTRDFAATRAEWTADGVLTVLGGAERGPQTAYRTDSGGDGSLGVREVARDVLAMAPVPGDGEVVLAIRAEGGESAISVLRA